MENKKNGRARILGLRSKNLKCLKEVEISPQGDITEIRGDAGQGKTSILESIRAAIEGMDPSMIRNGATAAEINLDLSTAKINRIIHSDDQKDYLTVTDTDSGKKIERAKEFLRALTGPTIFNPIE